MATEDYDTDGISIVAGDDGLFRGDGTVRVKSADVDLDTTHPGLENVAGHRVNGGSLFHDASASRIRSVSIIIDPGDDETYAAGDRIAVAVTFNETVSVFGFPQIGLDIGSQEKTATFWDRSVVKRDADRLGREPTVLLAYTVQEGDLDSDGISIGANRFSLNGGTIWDKTGNHADLTHEALPANGGHRVEGLDITSPAVSSISISSNPGGDGAYAIGDEIKLTVAFSEEVTVSGTPQLELGVGGEARTAEYEGSDGATLVFSYTVSEGDEATHGIAMGEDSLHINGARSKTLPATPQP